MVNDMGEICKPLDKEGGVCYVMIEKKCEKLEVPDGWVRLEMDDLSGHMSYPALVQEISQGFVNVYGRLPSSSPPSIGELATGDQGVGNSVIENIFINRYVFQIKRLTVLSVSEKDVYMFDMVQLLSNFTFGQ